MRLSERTVAEVRANPDIVGLISTYVDLKKRGRNHIGLCPFHSEKTPSFTVSPEKKIWHCFGCHEGGDHITFVMKMENLSFAEAVELIAEKTGIAVEKSDAQPISPQDKKRKIYQDILYEARCFFVDQFPQSPGYAYLQKRGISEKIAADFYLGFAPHNQKLQDWLKSKSFTVDDCIQAGVLSRSGSGEVLSRFRNRVVFPVLDSRGKTVGFGARKLDEQGPGPKYLNSDESALFNKRQLVYGLSQAHSAISQSRSIVFMEGYLDVLLAHQFGFKNAVATMGTALTRDHVVRLKRFADHCFLALDGDSAGQTATDKNIDLLAQFGFKIRIVNVDDADPAELLTTKGATDFQKRLDAAQHFIPFRYNRLKTKQSGTLTIEKKSELINQIIPTLKLEKDPITQTHYLKEMCTDLAVDHELVLANLNKVTYNAKKRFVLPISTSTDKYAKAEQYLLYLSAVDFKLRQNIRQTLFFQDFVHEDAGALYQQIIGSDAVGQDLLYDIKEEPQRHQLSRLLVEGETGVYELPTGNEWETCISVLKSFKKEKRIAQIKSQLKELESSGDDVATESLLKELNDLKVQNQ